MRFHLLRNLSHGSRKTNTPLTGREIKLKAKNIKDLLNYAGAKGYELDPDGKISNKEMIPRIAFFANIESVKLNLNLYIQMLEWLRDRCFLLG